ncbi:MAG TPA: NAD(P)-dependent oxidoreductase [Candidatus Acidoferrum sp.]|nr:NAD(P)-dependent oxidoreductase [Candidatus Acidoferrum sp.]
MAETIGFIGLGKMGEPIAANLQKAGFPLKLYNRTPAKAEALAAGGATVAAQPRDVAQAGGIVFTMLADDRAVESMCLERDSFVERLGKGGVHVSLSTISPSTARRLAEHHAKLGVAYVASPVFGRPEAAAAKLLWVCTSGNAEAKRRVRAALEAIGQGISDFGEEPGAANVVKLCGNFLIANAIEAMAEAFTLARKNGLEASHLSELFGKTLFACPVYQNYGRMLASPPNGPIGFGLALGLKDMNLVLQTGAESATPLPIASLLRDRFLASIAKGRSEMDWTATALDVAEQAGLK